MFNSTLYWVISSAFFIRSFYKMIVSRPITLKDMEAVDVELYNSIVYIKENDPEPLCLTFAINKTVFGEVSTRERERERVGRDRGRKRETGRERDRERMTRR